MSNRRQRRQSLVKPTRRPSARRRKPAQGGRRRAQPSFREALRGANSRAWRRSHQPSVQQAIAASHAGDLTEDFIVRHLWLRRFLAIFVLLPISIITTYSFFGIVGTADLEFWLETEFWHFALGFILWIGLFTTQTLRQWWLYLYVLGHELTHAIFIIASFGRIGEISISSEGGYVQTTKTSLLIALSPYFVPFWTVVLLSIYTLAAWIWSLPPMPRGVLVAMGFTWGFHLIWTIWMIPKDQPDLRENGVLFSLLFVYLINLGVILGLLSLASAIQPTVFVDQWLETLAQGRDALLGLARWLKRSLV